MGCRDPKKPTLDSSHADLSKSEKGLPPKPRYAWTMPDLFHCEKCGHPLDRKSGSTVRRAIVWLRGSGRTVQSVVEEEFRYAHDFCLSPGKDNDPTLF